LTRAWAYAAWIVPAGLVVVLAWRRSHVGLACIGWFVAALFPVLGFIPFGYQLYSTVADRYVYLAMVGPAYALACWLAGERSWRKVAATVAVLVVLAALTFLQTAHWRNGTALYLQAVRVSPTSDVANGNLGRELLERGNDRAAEPYLVRTLELNPRSSITAFNLGTIAERRGDLQQAEHLYRQAIEIEPGVRFPHVSLGVLLMNQQRDEAALEAFEAALRIAPSDLQAGFNRALVLDRLGRPAEAAEQLRTVLKNWPDHKPSRSKLGALLPD
jgi:tetratricopeptide (TPR) repeat protein